MCSMGFEIAITAGVRPQTYALDREATGKIVHVLCCKVYFKTAQK
jgi:hypothetical protein